MKANQDSFLKRRDKFFFAKLEKRYSKDELIYYFVSNFFDHDNVWSGNLVPESSESIYQDWKKRIQSLSYRFTQDCESLTDYKFDDLFKVEEYSHPLLLRKMMQKQICVETVIIMDNVLTFIKKWDKIIGDDRDWETNHQTCSQLKTHRLV